MTEPGGARRSSDISTSLTCARTFPIFIYDPRARARFCGKLDGKSFAVFPKGEYEMRTSVYISRGFARDKQRTRSWLRR